MPAHHKLELFLDEYIEAAEIADQNEALFFEAHVARVASLRLGDSTEKMHGTWYEDEPAMLG